MIVDPDFFDHWRTRMVVDALKDEMAPMYIMRLWGHCQSRKSDRHAMPPAGLKAQCRAPHDAIAFEQALTDAGFVVREGDTVLVLGWAEQNASLLAAWENGGKGGRPRKEPKENPAETHGKPTGNPAVTHGEPSANPDETDKSREEKSREEGEKKPSRKRADPPCPEDVESQVWDDWLTLRRKKSAPVTATVIEGARTEAAKAGMSLTNFLRVWCTRGSQGLEAIWLKPAEKAQYASQPDSQNWWDSQSGVERKAAELGIAKWGGAMQEQWPTYLARVRRAAKAEAPGLDLSQLAAMAAHQKGAH